MVTFARRTCQSTRRLDPLVTDGLHHAAVGQSIVSRDLNMERSSVSQWDSGRLDLVKSSLVLAEEGCREQHEHTLREHHEASLERLGASMSGKFHGRHHY